MGEVVIVGGGGHARVLASVLLKTGAEVIGYTDRQDRGPLLGAPWLGEDRQLAELLAARPGLQAALGVGKIDASPHRLALAGEVAALGIALPAVVSPDAVVNREVTLGEGSVVLDGVVVNSGARIGDLAILNTGCIVEHDCTLGRDVHVAPGAVLGGGVTVGDHGHLGAGSVVIQGVRLAPGCTVGAGAAVTEDLDQAGVYVGVPARRIR
jgi:sugar O-acyltransferase (sialic acid O-acetyltransferase NeuD family)